MLFIVPLGVGAAIYLEEYADRTRWWNRLIELNIQNLAAVPSIIYGILGLAFFVRGPLVLGFVVAAGSLTLALLVLPSVILAAREAIRAVPPSIREGSLALGATQWQTIRKQVLPASIPGIATGMILAVSRALGEAAPLILVGAATFVTDAASGFFERLTAMPVQIFNCALQPAGEFAPLAAAGDHRDAGRAAGHELRSRSGSATATSSSGSHRPWKRWRLMLDKVAEQARKAAGGRTKKPNRDVSGVREPGASEGAPKKGSKVKQEKIFELQDLSVFYAARRPWTSVSMEIAKNEITALIGPSGCGKSTLIRCLNRMNDLIPTAKVDGHVHLPRPGPLRPGGRPGRGAQADRHGLPEAEPVPEVDLRQHRLRAPDARPGRRRRARRARARERGALGRGQGPARRERLRHVGRPAAAPLHRALHRGRPRRDPDGRALLGAGPDLHRQDRGPDDGVEGATTRS